ncbi:MAG: hypothetical protein ACLT3D_03405 [Lawsonibacter sp.]
MVFCALAGALALTLAGCSRRPAPVPPSGNLGPWPSPVPAETEPAAEFSLRRFAAAPVLLASGAGAGAPLLAVRPDGSFYGEYHDTDMGVESRTSVRCSGTANLPAGLPSRCR